MSASPALQNKFRFAINAWVIEAAGLRVGARSLHVAGIVRERTL